MKFLPYGKHFVDQNDINSVVEVLKSDWLTTGPKIAELEEVFCSYTGSKYAVAVSSGTAALDLGVQALGIPKGSEVITTPLTFISTSNSLLYNGLVPIFTDIKQDTFNIDPEKIEVKITDKTKAISYVDYAGQPCEIKRIKEIAEDHDLLLIEDAAHALGAEYEGKKIGTFTDVTTFSLHPVKHITAGEGGIITTDDEETYSLLKKLRHHGVDKSGVNTNWGYDIKHLGKNYRITDFQCALAISQMNNLDWNVEKRNHLASIYSRGFKGIDKITPQVYKKNVRHAFHLYTILLDESIDRNNFIDSMRKENIGVNVHYIPIYYFTYYKHLFGYKPENYPVTENVFNRLVTLPLFPQMKTQDIKDVINTVEAML